MYYLGHAIALGVLHAVSGTDTRSATDRKSVGGLVKKVGVVAFNVMATNTGI